MNEEQWKEVKFFMFWVWLMITIIAAGSIGTALNVRYKIYPLLEQLNQSIQSEAYQLDVDL